ncbi:mechanosensitive ion channel family protein [Benzoatithermus flavus]|uniref:Mechanosensitive ion channel domain-containing protein n=1 Tax=Benzoatithermus flavus TaxID=3108223 RepID=A0ABU8XTF5_9PROT
MTPEPAPTLHPAVDRLRTSCCCGVSPLWRVCIILMVAACLLLPPGMAVAQTLPAPAAADRQADLQALDRVLGLLGDDARRSALIAELKQLRASLATSDDQHKAGGTANEEGLIGALATGIAGMGRDLPATGLGTALDRQVGDALDQLGDRLAAGLRDHRIESFLLQAVPGWMAAIVLAWAMKASPLVRRGRIVRIDACRARARGRRLLRMTATSSLRELLPLACGAIVLGAWPATGLLAPDRGPLFLTLAMPVLTAVFVKQIGLHGLMLLAPLRTWRVVGYAQQRVVPWLALLAAAAACGGILRSPPLHEVLGLRAAGLLALVADILVAGLAAAFILRHRRVVRYLLMGRRLKPQEEKALNPLRRVLRRMARRWHVLALLLVATNLAARLLGLGDGHFFRNAMLAVLVIALGLVAVPALDGAIDRSARHLRRGRSGTVRRIIVRLLELLRLAGHVAISAVLLIVVLEIWGFAVWDWLQSDVGAAIVRSLLSILTVAALAWTSWIAIDSVIAEALAPSDIEGQLRPSSSRAKTLLPFLRNLAFVTICLLAGITILDDLGVNVAPLLAGAGIVGLAIGFGSQQLVQDLITGLFILFEDTIAVGDVIDTGDRAGVVEALTIRTVRLRDGDGALHAIPFSQIKALKNRSRDYGVYTVKVTVGYDADLVQVMDVMREIGAGLQNDPRFSWSILAPLEVWGADEFTVQGVVVTGGIRTRPLQQWTVGREFNLRLKQRFDELGILIAIPRMSLVPPHARVDADGDRPATAPAAAGA